MSTKKKPTTKKVAPVIEEHPEPEPQDDVPSRQIDEVHDTEPESVAQDEPPVEPEPEKSAETQPIVEVVAETASVAAPIAEVKPPPVVEPAPVKPKPLTMTSLHADIEELRKIVDGQAVFIKQLLEAPVKQEKATS